MRFATHPDPVSVNRYRGLRLMGKIVGLDQDILSGDKLGQANNHACDGQGTMLSEHVAHHSIPAK